MKWYEELPIREFVVERDDDEKVVFSFDFKHALRELPWVALCISLLGAVIIVIFIFGIGFPDAFIPMLALGGFYIVFFAINLKWWRRANTSKGRVTIDRISATIDIDISGITRSIVDLNSVTSIQTETIGGLPTLVPHEEMFWLLLGEKRIGLFTIEADKRDTVEKMKHLLEKSLPEHHRVT
ncbi:MAG: hypothetical protein JW839_12765 [Candidatus Lokiarchaeota archaeon]|nr:hypothetical protein [Candidatus Lokiarchaeota archaeon]